jgi:hypothetical protein
MYKFAIFPIKLGKLYKLCKKASQIILGSLAFTIIIQ